MVDEIVSHNLTFPSIMTFSSATCRDVGIVYREDPDLADPGLNGVVVRSLEIPVGGVTAIMGPTASGKSTLLSLLGGLKAANVVSNRPHGSRIDLMAGSDRQVSILRGEQPYPGTLGYVFQESHVMKALPIGLNLEMARSLRAGRLSRDEFAALMETLHFVDPSRPAGRDALRNKLVRTLSGGQQQRIAVGRTVAASPQIVFCDEPTSSLDPHTARMIMDYLAVWAHGQGGTVLWVTHDETLALERADHILYVRGGRVFSDEGRPLSLDSGMDLPARTAVLDALKVRASSARPLTLAELDEEGLVLDPSPHTRTAALEPPRPAVRHRFNLPAIARFVFHFVRADLFERKDFSQGRRGGAARFFFAAWRGPYIFRRWTFAAVLCLGLLTCYTAILGYKVLDAALKRSLAQPEVAHFVLEAYGDVQDLMSLDALRGLEASLAGQFQAEITGGAEKPRVFGRRFDLLASVARADDRECGNAGSRDRSGAMLVYQQGEPLYSGLVLTTSYGRHALGELTREELRGKAIVTPGFLRRVLGVEKGTPPPAGFCWGEVDKAYVEIAGVADSLPGADNLQFEFAMTNDTYLRIMNEHPPASWGGVFPPFQTVALYFDAAYAERLFCRFRECDRYPGLLVQAFSTDYWLDEDALEQVKRLIGVAIGGRGVLLAILVLMTLAVAIAIGLSVKEFISSHERFICIMRAVGYRFRHMTLLFVLEFFVVTLVAVVLFSILLALFHTSMAPRLASLFALDPSWLGLAALPVSQAVGATFLFVCVFGLAILGIWWAQNRYVGQKLQGL